MKLNIHFTAVVKRTVVLAGVLIAVLINVGLTNPAIVQAGTTCGGGNGNPTQKTSIDIGCRGQGNPIMDMTFAIIRFLSVGVGFVLVASLIYAGIQYSVSRGEPQQTAAAILRIKSVVWSLLLYVFAYAFLNYVVPGQFLR